MITWLTRFPLLLRVLKYGLIAGAVLFVIDRAFLAPHREIISLRDDNARLARDLVDAKSTAQQAEIAAENVRKLRGQIDELEKRAADAATLADRLRERVCDNPAPVSVSGSPAGVDGTGPGDTGDRFPAELRAELLKCKRNAAQLDALNRTLREIKNEHTD